MANTEKKLLGCQAALQSNSSNLSSANTAQTIGELSAWYWGELQPDSPTYARLIISQCFTLTQRGTTTEAQHGMLPGVLVLIHSSNVGREIETLVQSPACRMVTRETPAAKAAEAASPQREARDICALAIPRTFLTQEEMVLVQTGQCCLLLLNKREVTLRSIWLLLNDSVCLK